jgi:hypothetical protein
MYYYYYICSLVRPCVEQTRRYTYGYGQLVSEFVATKPKKTHDSGQFGVGMGISEVRRRTNVHAVLTWTAYLISNLPPSGMGTQQFGLSTFSHPSVQLKALQVQHLAVACARALSHTHLGTRSTPEFKKKQNTESSMRFYTTLFTTPLHSRFSPYISFSSSSYYSTSNVNCFFKVLNNSN